MQDEILDEIENIVYPKYAIKSIYLFLSSVVTFFLLIVMEYLFDFSIIKFEKNVFSQFSNTISLIALILNIFGLINAFKSVKFKEVANWQRNFAIIGNLLIFLFYIFILVVYIHHLLMSDLI